MNIRNIIAALALVLISSGAYAQNRYVSQDAATVLGSDKYAQYFMDMLTGEIPIVKDVMEARASSALQPKHPVTQDHIPQ